MRALLFMLLAALLFAPGVPADEKKDEPPQKPPPARDAKPPPLSAEDAELIKEMALLEKLELVKNLELFEEDPQQPAPAPQRQP